MEEFTDTTLDAQGIGGMNRWDAAMFMETIPIDIFVNKRFRDPRVARIVARWPTEQQIIAKIIISHLKEMGIYQVARATAPDVTQIIIHLLHSSPYVLEVVCKDKEAETKRRASRHNV